MTFDFFSKTYERKNTGLYMEINGGDNNRVFHRDLLGENFGVKPYELFMDINGGDKNRVFLDDLIKSLRGQCQRGQFSCISSNMRGHGSQWFHI